jgi:hypothetical protein
MEERLPAVYECSVHGRQESICCITIHIGEPKVPEEQIREHVKCSHEGCKSIYWRPIDAADTLPTETMARMHGWTTVDEEKGLLHCAWGHSAG